MPTDLLEKLPSRIARLDDLAHNLWWSWHPAARMLFKMLDRQAWKESGHNPDKMLRELPPELLEKAVADTDYLRRYDAVLAMCSGALRRYLMSANALPQESLKAMVPISLRRPDDLDAVRALVTAMQ